jgi:hypothetical protein
LLKIPTFLIREVPVRIWDDGIKFALPGFLVVLGAAAAAPFILPTLAKIARPVTKAAIRLYLDLANDVQEVVAHHQPARRQPPGLVHHLLSGGTEELVTQGLEVEAEETVAESVVALVAEIL